MYPQILFFLIFIHVSVCWPVSFAPATVHVNTHTTATTPEKKFHLVIDPGHGGNDIGTAQNKIQESRLVLSIAQKIEKLIRDHEPDLKINLTRTENKYVSLEERIKKMSPDLFISLHANSSISNSVNGMETYFQPDQKIIAGTIKDHILQDLEFTGKTNRSLHISKILQSNWKGPSVIRRASFYVVAKAPFPSILVEIGFLTNLVEAEKLKTADYQTAIAESIVKTVIDYKKSIQ